MANHAHAAESQILLPVHLSEERPGPDNTPRNGDLESHRSSDGSRFPTKFETDRNAPAANTKMKPTHRFRLALSAWGLEILAIILSFASFVAIIIVLLVYQNSPQEAWPYNHLTLNGLIAFLSTVTQAALFVAIGAAISQAKWTWYTHSKGKPFGGRPLEDLAIIDEASRGTLGSLKLLWMTKGYHLVAVGAALTIMALAFDTFVQQVLTVNFRNTVITKPAEIAYFPRSENYPVGTDISLTQVGSTALDVTASVDMQAAITSGILAAQVNDVVATCSTGNCTWPIIPTIAVCGACTNISQKLNTTCNDAEGMCSHKLPSGLDLTIEYNNEFGAGSGNVVWFTSAPTSTGVYKSGNIGAGVNILPDQENVSADPMYVANFEAINVPYLSKNSDYRQTPVATQCALWFCLQAFNVSFTSGRQTQNVTATWSKLSYLSTANGGSGLHQFTDIPSSFNVALNSTFTIDTLALIALQQSFNFSQSISVVEYGNAAIGQVSSPFAEGLWYGSQDWDAWIVRLAKSVSNNLRENYAANLSTAPAYAGTTYAEKSFITVRWAWLAYPAAMLVMGVGFLAATIWVSRERGVGAWKDGVLTLLMARLEDDLIKEETKGVNVGEVWRRRRVRLEDDKGVLTFRGVN